MTHEEQALQYFTDGANCAQAVLLAFKDDLGMDEKTAAKLASSFGGGIGRLREVCGAVSGMLMALGLIRGYDNVDDLSHKQRLYAEGAMLINAFKAEFGTANCAELKTQVVPRYEQTSHPLVTEEFTKPCSPFVAYAAALLDAYLAEVRAQ